MRGMRVRGLDLAAGVSLAVCLVTVGVGGERGAVVLGRFGYRHVRWAVVSKDGVLAVSNQLQVEWERSRRRELEQALVAAVRRRAEDREKLERYFSHHPDPRRITLEEWRAGGSELLEASGGAEHLVTTYRWTLSTMPTTALVERRVPAWAAVAVGAVLPGVWVAKWTVRRRRKWAGACVACGYDLTGNVSGVCPECGVPAARRTEAMV